MSSFQRVIGCFSNSQLKRILLTHGCLGKRLLPLRFPLVLILLVFQGLSAKAEEKVFYFTIPEGIAVNTVREVAHQTGVDILLVDASVSEVTTNQIQGRYSVSEALKIMLEGTRLEVVRDSESGAYAITVAKSKHEASGSIDITTTTQSNPQNNKETEMNAKKKSWFRALAAVLTLGLAESQIHVNAQDREEDDEIVELMTYGVEEEADTGYYASNSITGTRTRAALLNIPLTVNIVTSELMEDTNMIRLEDAFDYTPGINKSFENDSRFSLRGFNDTNPRLNGISTMGIAHFDTAVIDRIEVLKGSNAALYGSTSGAGGFVNILTKKPLFSPYGRVSLSSGTTHRDRMVVDVTGPLALEGNKAQFAYRLVGAIQDGSNKGWRDYTNDAWRMIISPSLTWRPTPKTEITLELYRDRYETIHETPIIPAKGTDQSNTYFDELSPSFNINGPDSFNISSTDAAFLYITQQINDDLGLRLTSANIDVFEDFYRRQGFTEASGSPSGGGIIRTFPLSRPDLNRKREWHRADLMWNPGFMDKKLSVLVGLQYSDDTFDDGRISGPNENFNLFSFTEQDLRLPPLSTLPVSVDRTNYTRSALFNTVVSYSVLEERLNLFTTFAKQMNAKGRTVDWLRGQNPGSIPWNKIEDPDDYGFGFSYKITPEISFFGMYNNDSQINSLDENGNRFPNRTQNQYEIGVKYNLSSRVSGSVSIFNIKRTNLVSRDFALPNTPLVSTGEEISEGIEVEHFMSYDNGISAIFGLSYLNAEIGTWAQRPDLEGAPLVSAPQFSGSVWLKYSPPKNKALTLGTGLIYSDPFSPYGPTSAANRALALAPGYTVANLMAGYTFELANDKEMILKLNVANVTDEKYLIGMGFGDPRHATLSLDYRF